MNSMLTVMKFTIRNKLYSKSYIITTLIIALLMALGANAPYLIQKLTGNSEPTKVGYIEGQHSEITQGLPTTSPGRKSPMSRWSRFRRQARKIPTSKRSSRRSRKGKSRGTSPLRKMPKSAFPT